MAKLTAPLFSLSASGKLADALVYFAWKGLAVVRSYAVPSQPQTAAQVTQRGYLTDAVLHIHTAQALAVAPLDAVDVTAYALLASVYKSAQTWFNEAVRGFINQNVASLKGMVFRNGTLTPGDSQLGVTLGHVGQDGVAPTAGDFWYGTSKTSMINSETAVIADPMTCTITGLTNGVKYYVQFRPTAGADFVGVRSGIYTATPAA